MSRVVVRRTEGSRMKSRGEASSVCGKEADKQGRGDGGICRPPLASTKTDRRPSNHSRRTSQWCTKAVIRGFAHRVRRTGQERLLSADPDLVVQSACTLQTSFFYPISNPPQTTLPQRTLLIGSPGFIPPHDKCQVRSQGERRSLARAQGRVLPPSTRHDDPAA